ncbi:hypothetical protein MYAM1_002301 [Malassezia yamatoensis]|uniref:OPA3-domain-containing protein n=1 Tax=Malassezia yamatoensis TaxID=253288 RepID=A0AAJ5YTL9_9BASI|nr:hypothetical protein MYAM1_002301 [Malassezia yamatoensis]
MATAKLVTLAIRTLAKPIATSLKSRATQHEMFRKICIELAQKMHRTEIRLRQNLVMGQEIIKVRPLNDAKAISNGANAISEGFLFAVAASLIIGETYRGSRSRAHAQDRVEERFEELQQELRELRDVIQHGHTPTNSDVAPTTPKSVDEQALHSLRLSTQLLWKLAERHGWLSDRSLVEEMHWALQDDSDPNKQAKIDSGSDVMLHHKSDTILDSRTSHTPDTSSGRQSGASQTVPSQETDPASPKSQSSQAPEALQTPPQESSNGSPNAQELGQQRAHAIIQEIRQQTSPTPIQLPSLDSMRSGSASIFGSLTFRLPTLHHDPRSFLQWTSPTAFEAYSSFT